MKKTICKLLAVFLAVLMLCPTVSVTATEPNPAGQLVVVRAASIFSKITSLFKGKAAETEDANAKLKEKANMSDSSTVDFEALQKQNPDIYAWIEIVDTDISYPILRRAGNDSYYLSHDCLGNKSTKGAIYTESYNSMNFSDPTTVIYGHTTVNGTLFGTLQANYSDPTFFNSHKTIKIYLPDAEYTYKVFAAVPFKDTHILYYYNFYLKKDFDSFYNAIFANRSLYGNVDKSTEIDLNDNVIILSTCIAAERDKRFLVLAVRETEK